MRRLISKVLAAALTGPLFSQKLLMDYPARFTLALVQAVGAGVAGGACWCSVQRIAELLRACWCCDSFAVMVGQDGVQTTE